MEKRRILPALLSTALLSLGLVIVSTPAKSEVVKAAEGTWTLVDDASTLADGDQIVIAAAKENYAMSTTQNNNNRASVAITKSGSSITVTSTVQVLTLKTGKTAGSFAFYTGSAGYLYAASTSSNHLKTKTALDNNDFDTLRNKINELEQAAAYMSSQGAAPQGDAAPGSNPDDVVDADFTDKKD